MNGENVDDWESFERRLEEIRQAESSAGRTTEFLFRGQGDSKWELDTTLDRAWQKRTPIESYRRLIYSLRPQIESFTGAIPEMAPVLDPLQPLRDLDGVPDPRTYSYMVHLRHHGFPSPLLDWTRSPYVAAFFAFRSTSKPCSGRVSVYVLSESPDRLKVTSITEPEIRVIGPKVRTHRRHFRQQCDYTICVIFDKEWRYAKHEEVFARRNPSQDVLWKLNIPWAERRKVLKQFDAFNLNAFSLFESEESLMETLAVRTMEFPENTP
jgi:FRG domain